MITTQKQISNGCECTVFETDNPDVVFKLYNRLHYTKQQVQQIIDLNQIYTKRNLAPQVLSDIIEQDGEYGYYAERVKVMTNNEREACYCLADKLAISEPNQCELYGNCGWTKDRELVLFDFGPATLWVLGLLDYDKAMV